MGTGIGRYLVEAHLREGRGVGEIAKANGVHRSWLYKLLQRYRQHGELGLVPRSRRPRRCPGAMSQDIEDEIVRLRRDLVAEGLDAGALTIHWHLARAHAHPPSVSSIWRALRRRGLVAFPVTSALDVARVFQDARARFGAPASVLTDNGCIFTAEHRSGRTVLETELARLGIEHRRARPYHPQTCGKVERFHQTLKRYLAKQAPAASLALLQAQLDHFAGRYNDAHPHRALGRRTPRAVYETKVRAAPAGRAAVQFRVRYDRVDQTGKVSLRYDSKLLHLGLGNRYKGQRVVLLVADRDVRALNEDGELLCRFVLDPGRDYQPKEVA